MSPALLIGVYLAEALVMAAAWWWQKRTGNIGWVDVFWTFGVAGGGLVAALSQPVGDGSPARTLLVCVMVIVWALRLGLYVAFRVAGSPEDGRYAALRQSWGETLQPRLFWFLQAQAVVSVILAAAIGLAANRPDPSLGFTDALGVLIALLAIAGEALADGQVKTFRNHPQNKDKVCDTGLWSLSRHPNYVFEWLGWFAYPIMAISLSAYPEAWWALLAPLVMFAVLRFGTGVPPLEAHMERSRGQAFRDYQARVPIFLPRLTGAAR